jgi:hypothetical protein
MVDMVSMDEFPKGDLFGYHITRRENVEGILEDGIQPGKGSKEEWACVNEFIKLKENI